MKYTKIPADTFKNLQLNAGVLLKSFDVETQTLAADAIVGATSGGVSFTAVPSSIDFGEDIDNCPKGTKEMMHLDYWEAKMSGTFASVSKSLAKTLVGAADLAGSKITPRNDFSAADFSDIWWVGDYSEVNEDGTSTGKAGFIAIHLLNALSTGGFSIQSSDKGKGQFEFEFSGHYSMEDQDRVPFDLYVQEGTAA